MTTKTATNSFGILRNRKSSTVGLPYPRSLQPLVHAVRVRGTEFLSKENLTSFIAVHGLLMGAGFEFASNLMMKLMHNYHDKGHSSQPSLSLGWGTNVCFWVDFLPLSREEFFSDESHGVDGALYHL